MRGMYTAGVLDVLMENGIGADGIVGTSAGALFGVNFLSGQVGRVIRYNKRFNSDPNYLGLRPLLLEGNIVSTKYAYHDVPHIFDPFDDDRYRQSTIPFYAVVTNILTGQPEYIRVRSVYDQMDVLRASGSMPFVSRPVKIDGKTYLDGGIADSIPFQWLSGQGYDKLVVVLTRDMQYRKSPMSPALIRLFYQKYPELCKQLANRHTVYNDSVSLLAEWEKLGKAFVIRPSQPIEIGRIEKDPEKLQSVYDLGVADAKRRLADLRSYLA